MSPPLLGGPASEPLRTAYPSPIVIFTSENLTSSRSAYHRPFLPSWRMNEAGSTRIRTEYRPSPGAFQFHP